MLNNFREVKMATRFVVDLGSTKLTREQTKRIERSIQQAALKEIAVLDIGGRPGDWISRLPKTWLGLILHLRGRIADLPRIETELRKFGKL